MFISDWRIVHATGRRSGLVHCLPYTPGACRTAEEMVYRKIVQTGRMAERLGADILGLGAFTSVVGDAGRTIADRLQVPVTTGDAYTVGLAVQAIREAGRLMDIDLEKATVAVMGATGAIGRVCSQLLAGEAGRLLLIARESRPLELLRDTLRPQARADRHRTT
jgi:predicted amino acid dehydrogenase